MAGVIRLVAALAAFMFACSAFAQRSTPLQVLQPSGAGTDLFGSAVAIDGDTMIVGAPRDDVGANADQGSA
ncbi:MAG: FG-GAP repeat protein, partial [Phycisphaerae bacterium]